MRNRQVFRKTRTGYTFKYRRGEFIQIEPSVFVRGDGKLLDRVVAVRDLPRPQRERAEMDTIDQAMARPCLSA
jgi:hypothetical protein